MCLQDPGQRGRCRRFELHFYRVSSTAEEVAQLLRYFGDQYIALVVLASFLAIGVPAERTRYM